MSKYAPLMHPQVGDVLVIDPEDISSFLSALILSGNIEDSLHILLRHTPPVEKERCIERTMQSFYAGLPGPLSRKIKQQQGELNPLPGSGLPEYPSEDRKYNVLAAMVALSPIMLMLWFYVFYVLAHRFAPAFLGHVTHFFSSLR